MPVQDPSRPGNGCCGAGCTRHPHRATTAPRSRPTLSHNVRRMMGPLLPASSGPNASSRPCCCAGSSIIPTQSRVLQSARPGIARRRRRTSRARRGSRGPCRRGTRRVVSVDQAVSEQLTVHRRRGWRPTSGRRERPDARHPQHRRNPARRFRTAGRTPAGSRSSSSPVAGRPQRILWAGPTHVPLSPSPWSAIAASVAAESSFADQRMRRAGRVHPFPGTGSTHTIVMPSGNW